MNLGIIIITYNLPADVFLLQMEAIGEFCKDEYTIEIYDNSSIFTLSESIKYHAKNLNLLYYKTFSSSQNGSDSHSFAANFAYHRVKNHYTHLLFLDHDLIPVKSFSVYELLENKIIAGLGQGAKKVYFWPGCVMFNNEQINKDLIDFSPNSEYGLDTGGNLYQVVEKYGKDNCIFFNESYHQNPYFVDNQYGHYSMINNEMFMHFVNSSNWNNRGKHEERLNSLKNIANQLINGEKDGEAT